MYSWEEKVGFYPRSGKHVRVPAVACAAFRVDYARFVFSHCVGRFSKPARLSVATGRVVPTLEGASSTRARSAFVFLMYKK